MFLPHFPHLPHHEPPEQTLTAASAALFPKPDLQHLAPGGQRARLGTGGCGWHLFIFHGAPVLSTVEGSSTRNQKGRFGGTSLSLLLVAGETQLPQLAQGPPRNTARAIRIFRGIMIAEWKHICPQKSLIFPAVMNQLGRKWWLSELQEPKLKRKKCTKLEQTLNKPTLSWCTGGGSTQAPERLIIG